MYIRIYETRETCSIRRNIVVLKNTTPEGAQFLDHKHRERKETHGRAVGEQENQREMERKTEWARKRERERTREG